MLVFHFRPYAVKASRRKGSRRDRRCWFQCWRSFRLVFREQSMSLLSHFVSRSRQPHSPPRVNPPASASRPLPKLRKLLSHLCHSEAQNEMQGAVSVREVTIVMVNRSILNDAKKINKRTSTCSQSFIYKISDEVLHEVVTLMKIFFFKAALIQDFTRLALFKEQV